MRRKFLFASFIVCGSALLRAQSAERPRSFEAAVVRPSTGHTERRMAGGPEGGDPAQITYWSVTLADLIAMAYDVRLYQMKGGPDWLDSGHFDVIAKLPPASTKDDLRVMLQSLLEDRFQLVVHREKQEGQYYDLVVDKGGPKLKASSGPAPEHGTVEFDEGGAAHLAPGSLGRPVTVGGKNILTLVSGGRVLVVSRSQSISALARTLARIVNAPVQDLTRLTGEYDFTLDFAPPDGMRVPPMAPPGECPTCLENPEPPLSIFQALKNGLGLRLEARRGLVDLLVVDHAGKIPTEN